MDHAKEPALQVIREMLVRVERLPRPDAEHSGHPNAIVGSSGYVLVVDQMLDRGRDTEIVLRHQVADPGSKPGASEKMSYRWIDRWHKTDAIVQTNRKREAATASHMLTAAELLTHRQARAENALFRSKSIQLWVVAPFAGNHAAQPLFMWPRDCRVFQNSHTPA